MSLVVATANAPAIPAVRLPTQPVRKPFWRPSTIITSLVFIIVLVTIAQRIIDFGYERVDVAALHDGDAWRTGGWLSQVVLRVVGLIPDGKLQQTVLSLLAAGLSGALFGVLYDRLRANGWFVIGSVLLLVAVACHMGALFTFTAASRAIPLYIALAAMIPAIRSLEEVGDVQSAIGLGLILPLLLLASPIGTVLIIPLAIAAALANADARRDPRAFVAMLLVAFLPSFIVGIGIVGFVLQARLDLFEALLPYLATYTNLHFGDYFGSLKVLVVYAPVLIVPVIYCFWPGLPEKRHIFSALAVVALPLYLALARVTFTTAMLPIVPPLAVIVSFISWVAVTRLPISLRVLAVFMLVVSTVLSWTVPGVWEDPDWKEALFRTVPAEIGNLQLRPGV